MYAIILWQTVNTSDQLLIEFEEKNGLFGLCYRFIDCRIFSWTKSFKSIKLYFTSTLFVSDDLHWISQETEYDLQCVIARDYNLYFEEKELN